MRRPLAIALAVLVLAVSASPALAKRSGSNVSPTGSIQVWLTPVKDDPGICAVKISAKGLASSQTVYIGRAENWGGTAMDIGNTNADGTINQSNTSGYRSDYNNSYTVVVIQSSWYSVLGTDGQQATWSVSNTCKPN